MGKFLGEEGRVRQRETGGGGEQRETDEASSMIVVSATVLCNQSF